MLKAKVTTCKLPLIIMMMGISSGNVQSWR